VTYSTSATAGVVNRASTITASSTGFSSPRYRFWVVTPTGQWTKPCGDYGTATSCVFTPNATGTWTVAVVVRESTSTASYDVASPERPYTVGTTSTSTSTSSSSSATCPPEPTTPDANGEPRNAAGDIRYCWPGEAYCHCDSDNDCYALDGYVPCNATYSDEMTNGDGGNTGATTTDGSATTATTDPSTTATDPASGDTGGGYGCDVRGKNGSNGMLTTVGLLGVAFAVSQVTRRRRNVG
jgi:hypothetical protein